MAAAQMMGPPPSLSAKDFAGVSAGQPVSIVVRVKSLKRTTMRAEILDKQTEGDYRATGTEVELYFPQSTQIIMGTKSDVVRGAVLAISAVATKRAMADAKKAVVITQYVKVH